MDEREDPIEVRVMNDYGVEFPLWGSDGDIGPDDPEDAGLSPELTADLHAFAARWEAHISPESTDDRWDGIPVVRSVVERARALRTWADRDGRRQWEAEAAAMAELGEQLARRVQDELGPRYAVTYRG